MMVLGVGRGGRLVGGGGVGTLVVVVVGWGGDW